MTHQLSTPNQLRYFMFHHPEDSKAIASLSLRDKARSFQSYLSTKGRFFSFRKISPDSFQISILFAKPSQTQPSRPWKSDVLEELRKINERLDTIERNISSILANTDKPIPF